MPSDEFTADLTKLDQDYQILTELHRTDDTRTYLARHLGLNRDVTITVMRGATGDKKSLSRFAGDVARLKTARHPSVVPVIEGRWLGDGVFAVVRARVRGATLDQLVSATGPIPLGRIAGTLDEVRGALDWARGNGIANRHVAEDTLVFQQGSGRVLLTLESSDSSWAVDACDDARTIGRLAWEMLTGEAFDVEANKSLATLRPDLSPAIVAETEALMHCERGAPRDVGAYIALLGGNAEPKVPVAVAAVPVVPAAPAIPRFARSDPEPSYAASVESSKDAVVPVKHGWGFGTRFAVGAAVLAAAAVVAFLFLNRRDGPAPDVTAMTTPAQVAGEAGGDVAAQARQADSALLRAGVQPPPVISVPKPTPAPQQGVPDSVPTPRLAPPETRRHEPPRIAPPVSLPVQPVTPDSVTMTVSSGDVCSSTAAADQRRCLMNSIDRNDADLNGVYQRLIAALRRQANVNPDDPDPESIDRVRAAQRRWLDDRDQTCHTVGSGALYARDRAQCFADQSAARVKELKSMLDSIP